MTWEEFQKKYVHKRGKATASEHDLQVQCVNWFRATYPELLIFAIPNGGYRAITTASAMRAEGQTAGVPDLCVPVPRGEYAALYIEMKNGKAGRLSDNQKQMSKKLLLLGNKVVVCRTMNDFMEEVQKYLLLPCNDRIVTNLSTSCAQSSQNV